MSDAIRDITRQLRALASSREMAILFSVFLLAAAALAFVAVADNVTEGDTQTFDETILLALRSPEDLSDPVGGLWLEEVGRDVTALGGVAVLTFVTFAVIGYLLLRGRRREALFVGAAVGGGILLSSLLKRGFDRPRPDLVPYDSHVYTASFPSGHSMMAAVTYLTLAALLARVHKRRRVKLYFILLAAFVTIAVGLSRVYTGVHWPTDVLAGWTAGSFWAMLCWQAGRWLQRRGHIEREGLEAT